ncbi:MAG: cysteine--tRNA ligase, partial [Candidatus Diapherotrites archaeon]|nr:cysteine--tRNA ligase [Candidatus Diapherotrites archaeon]
MEPNSESKAKLRFFNTLSREVEDFVPINEDEVGIYTCGPTVYSRAHIGNLKAYTFADVLRRTLEYAGYNVKHVMNITDVGHLTSDADEGEDKIQKGARLENLTAWDVAKKYTGIFLQDTKDLNMLPVHVLCRATDHIEQQINLVKRLEENGFTYIISDGVYFDTSKFLDYSKFARLNIDGLDAGKRIDMGEKKNKTDFALWKFSPANEKRDMEWDSPWGKGFPGWHIECS